MELANFLRLAYRPVLRLAGVGFRQQCHALPHHRTIWRVGLSQLSYLQARSTLALPVPAPSPSRFLATSSTLQLQHPYLPPAAHPLHDESCLASSPSRNQSPAPHTSVAAPRRWWSSGPGLKAAPAASAAPAATVAPAPAGCASPSAAGPWTRSAAAARAAAAAAAVAVAVAATAAGATATTACPGSGCDRFPARDGSSAAEPAGLPGPCRHPGWVPDPINNIGVGVGPLVWRLQNAEPPVAPSKRDGSSSGGGRSSSSGGAAAKAPAAAPAPPTPPPPSGMSEGSAYAVYDAAGAPSTFEALLASLESYDVVLLGEYHDDPVAHHLQLRVLRHVLGTARDTSAGRDQRAGVLPAPGSRGASPSLPPPPPSSSGTPGAPTHPPSATPARPVALSLEMFERDVQGVMDEYLAGFATEADLMKDGRPWPNYPTDYRPLVLAAKAAGAPVVCANAPRRYVSLVGRSGAAALASLPPTSLRHLPPLPLRPASEQYVAKIRWTMQRAREPPRNEGNEGTGGWRDGGGAEDDDGGEQGGQVEVAAPLVAAPAPEPSGGGAAAAAAGVTRSNDPSASGSPAAAGGSARNSTSANGGANGVGGGECPHIGMTLRSNFVDAQNLWDAAMADAIARALRRLQTGAGAAGAVAGAAGPEGGGAAGGGAPGAAAPPGRRPLVVHVCGKFHSEQRLGICEHMAAAAPEAAVGVVTFVPSGRGVAVPSATLTSAGLHTYGNWLVLTDTRLPRSFESEHPV